MLVINKILLISNSYIQFLSPNVLFLFLKNFLTKIYPYDRKQKTKLVFWLLWNQKKELKF
jgi:hypothetical protein